MDAVLKIRWLIWETGDLIPLSSKYFSRPAPHIRAKHSGVHLKLLVWQRAGMHNGGLFCMIHPLEWILPWSMKTSERERLSFNEIEKQSSHPEGKELRIYQMLFFCVWNSKSISFSSTVFLSSNYFRREVGSWKTSGLLRFICTPSASAAFADLIAALLSCVIIMKLHILILLFPIYANCVIGSN